MALSSCVCSSKTAIAKVALVLGKSWLWSVSLHFSTQRKMLLLPQYCSVVGLQKMSRLSLMFLIVTSLALTVYFGSVAWRVSDDGDNDITGHVLTGQGNGWRSAPAR
jgi:hypothetical protein